MKVWISKYALSRGVFEAEGKPYTDASRCLSFLYENGIKGHAAPQQWHPTRKSALARAEAMRVARIEALKKQIRKLEDLSFRE